jgi:organic radical activating enzyme
MPHFDGETGEKAHPPAASGDRSAPECDGSANRRPRTMLRSMLLSRMTDGEPEIFRTVQGEGPSTGTPAVFVRLAECNLRCSFCDTAYTWDWDRHDRLKETIEVGDVMDRVRAAAGAAKTVVFTGGEPLLQQDAIAELDLHGFRIEVETNGTITPNAALGAAVDQWNVSPKLASSGNAERARLRPAALGWFAQSPRAFFKFVVTGAEDLAEVEQMVEAFALPRERVLLMPEGTDAATITERSRWLAETCAASGLRLGTRLHVFLWGASRGR